MKKGLFAKAISAYSVIIAVSFVMTSAILSFWFQKYYYDDRTDQLMRAANQLSQSVSQYIIQGEMSEVMFEQRLQDVDNILNADIILTDSNGYALVSANDDDDVLINKPILLSSDLKILRNGNSVIKRGSYGNLFKTQMLTVIAPLQDRYSGKLEGTLMMNTSMAEMQKNMGKVFVIIWTLATIAIVLPCFIIYNFSQRVILKPLREIIDTAKRISKGEVDKRVEIESQDEIGELVDSFNSMADSIAKVEKNRREFISNVSHEIRSPITSIKGFIGGILDGVIPKEKEKYYLSLAFDETQRLTRLVNDLLDLSAIDAGQLTLNISSININELIRRTVIKFETKVKERKLNVDVCFNQDNLYVVGDPDRINQVITNLIDNAIKYVLEEGDIKIAVKTKGDKAYISIYNDCNPLSDEEINHIWDRFYKRDKSRTVKVSTGLGLPIVRSILTEHGEDIWVKNYNDSGIKFEFTLKKA